MPLSLHPIEEHRTHEYLSISPCPQTGSNHGSQREWRCHHPDHLERAQYDRSRLDPYFSGLYPYIIRESQHTIIPGYGALLQHTFLAGCSSLSTPTGCTAFVPLAACVWTAELLVAISLMFGLFTRLGAILATILSLQLYVGLAYAPGEWIWTYGMLVLLALALVAVPAGRRLGADQWLAPRLQAAGQQHRIARIASWLV